MKMYCIVIMTQSKQTQAVTNTEMTSLLYWYVQQGAEDQTNKLKLIIYPQYPSQSKPINPHQWHESAAEEAEQQRDEAHETDRSAQAGVSDAALWEAFIWRWRQASPERARPFLDTLPASARSCPCLSWCQPAPPHPGTPCACAGEGPRSGSWISIGVLNRQRDQTFRGGEQRGHWPTYHKTLWMDLFKTY